MEDSFFTSREVELLVKGGKLESLVNHDGWKVLEEIVYSKIRGIEYKVLNEELKQEEYEYQKKLRKVLTNIFVEIYRIVKNKNELLKKYEYEEESNAKEE